MESAHVLLAGRAVYKKGKWRAKWRPAPQKKGKWPVLWPVATTKKEVAIVTAGIKYQQALHAHDDRRGRGAMNEIHREQSLQINSRNRA